ncbi:MAG TPA: argininosuccinate lyase, partial [Phycisphaerae bacterium]|nr:argininosuccinate lyase [Phycisphaerae bacterium]
MTRKRSKSWQARFSQSPHALTETYVESLSFDRRLWKHDIAGSIAHAEMLAEVGLISHADCRAIRKGLASIAADIQAVKFKWDLAHEDIHMAVEAALIRRVGEPGQRLHTARSRNDQIALDLRLYTRDAVDLDIVPRLRDVQQALVALAGKYVNAVMPSYTHLQRAQPISLAAYLLAYVEQFERDRERFLAARERLNVCPLGSGALAGSTLPIDRRAVARRLGFAAVTRNSIDSTGDRDFIVEFLAAAALCGIHLSRLAEDWVLYASQEFRFVRVADAFCTGSSMMPQKRNLDVMELLRGKVGRIVAALSGMITLTKGLPQAYNRDLQEDKIHLFSAHDTLSQSLEILAEVVRHSTFDARRLAEATRRGFLDATCLAEYLVGKGVPFRQAHQHVGRLVALAEKRDTELADLPLEVFRAECDA